MSNRKKRSPPTPEVEDLIDRLDDRYLTQQNSIYYFGALASAVLTFITWVVISIFSIKESIALLEQTVARNEAATEEFIQYHKEQLEILKSTTQSTDITVTAIKHAMDAKLKK